MRKELILEDAGPQLDDWREAYVEKLTTQLPKAIVLPMGETVKISRRGQRVWIALSKKNSEDVRIVTATRSSLIPLGIIFCVIGVIYMIALAASYMSSMSSYYSCLAHSTYYYSYCYYPSTYMVIPFVPVIAIFLGLGAALLKTNKTRTMQSMAIRIARETWLSFSRRVEAKTFSRPVPRSPPQRASVPSPPREQDRMMGHFCMYCGTPVEKAGAKFCENCGKNLSY